MAGGSVAFVPSRGLRPLRDDDPPSKAAAGGKTEPPARAEAAANRRPVRLLLMRPLFALRKNATIAITRFPYSIKRGVSSIPGWPAVAVPLGMQVLAGPVLRAVLMQD